jgi:hypothetical protein
LAVKTWYHSGSLAWMSVNIHTLCQQLGAPATSLKNPQYSHWYVTVHNEQPTQYLHVKLQKNKPHHQKHYAMTQAVSCHLSPRRTRFNPRSVHVTFVMKSVARRPLFSLVLRSPAPLQQNSINVQHSVTHLSPILHQLSNSQQN